ncbi:EAL domain-containing protein [Butyrivibrio sp. MC2013]|uniref:EAL domain-containing protein n=1 Tax=Butyrivibrio sp. MC2013 TaxID=1280686 RepID=UPI00042241C6|nr:EAL domain-containing protein [Butyrivibrio sp. MC2013]
MDSYNPEGSIDELTGLSNYTQFRNLAQDVMNNPELRKQIAFIYFNIENFRSYNERYGSAAGDDCLVLVARTIDAFFPQEICARMGADHFAVVADKTDIEEKIEGVCDEFRPFRVDTRLQLSAGIYLPADDEYDAVTCIDKAKVACDTIRNEYDKKFGYYDEKLDRTYQRERYIVAQLDSAIENGYIYPYYQSIVRCLTGNISGYEALARWNDPEIGLISPGDFVPILEKYHMIKKLDLAIIEKVCIDKNRIKAETGSDSPTSVNLSQQDFSFGDIFTDVHTIISRYDINPSEIHIEITESVFSMEKDLVNGCIKRFREAGYEIWMDDFGSGFSSLNTLKDYEFDCLKMDMKFIHDFTDNEQTRTILESVMDMTKRLGIKTVAEGVETNEAAEYLRSIGCDNLQGFLYSRPVDLEKTISDNRTNETKGMRKYYEGIGRLNLLSSELPLGMSGASAHDDFYGAAMSIVECQGDELSILNYNPKFKEFLESIDIRTIEEANELMSRKRGQLPSRFLNVVRIARSSGSSQSVDFVKSGQSCNCRFIPISSYKNRSAFLNISINLTATADVSRSSRQEAMLRFVYSQYNRLDLIDVNEDTIHNVYINTAHSRLIKKGSSIKDSYKEFAMAFVMDVDVERFLRFYDIANLKDRIEHTFGDYVTDYFRCLGADSRYNWQQFTVIRADLDDHEMFLSCISDVDIDRIRMLQGMDEASRDLPRNPVFMWLSSRGYAEILGYESYKSFLDNSYYFEVNLTQNIVNEMHLAGADTLLGRDYKEYTTDYEQMMRIFLDLTTNADDEERLMEFYSRDKLLREFENGNKIGSIEYCSYLEHGPVWLHSSYQMMRLEETGEIICYFLTYNIDTYKKKILSDRRALERDTLTGIYNRYSAVPMIREYMHKHSSSQCGLVMMDLDNFKEINDKYGHECGDNMLKALARKLDDNFGMYGFACRLGGDEFMGFIKDRSALFVEEFLANFTAKPVSITYKKNKVSCTISAGFVMFPEHGRGYHDLYRKADMALYKAKLAGKNCFCKYIPDEDTGDDDKILVRNEDIIQNIPCGLLVCTVNNDHAEIISVNDMAINMCGFTNLKDFKEYYNNSCENILWPEDREELLCRFVNFVEEHQGTKDVMHCDMRIICSDNSAKTIKVAGRVLPDAKGDKLHMVWMDE